MTANYKDANFKKENYAISNHKFGYFPKVYGKMEYLRMYATEKLSVEQRYK